MRGNPRAARGYNNLKRRARRRFERLWRSQNQEFGSSSPIQDGALSKDQAWQVFLTAFLEGSYDETDQNRRMIIRHEAFLKHA